MQKLHLYHYFLIFKKMGWFYHFNLKFFNRSLSQATCQENSVCIHSEHLCSCIFFSYEIQTKAETVLLKYMHMNAGINAYCTVCLNFQYNFIIHHPQLIIIWTEKIINLQFPQIEENTKKKPIDYKNLRYLLRSLIRLFDKLSENETESLQSKNMCFYSLLWNKWGLIRT